MGTTKKERSRIMKKNERGRKRDFIDKKIYSRTYTHRWSAPTDHHHHHPRLNLFVEGQNRCSCFIGTIVVERRKIIKIRVEFELNNDEIRIELTS